MIRPILKCKRRSLSERGCSREGNSPKGNSLWTTVVSQKRLQPLTIFTFLTLENQTILWLMPAIILELVGGTLMTSTQHIARIVFPKSFSKKKQTNWNQVHNKSNCRRGWRISVWLRPKECSLAEMKYLFMLRILFLIKLTWFYVQMKSVIARHQMKLTRISFQKSLLRNSPWMSFTRISFQLSFSEWPYQSHKYFSILKNHWYTQLDRNAKVRKERKRHRKNLA